MVKKKIIFLFLCLFTPLLCDLALVPVSYKGRIRPLKTYTDATFYQFYHANRPNSEDAGFFPSQDPLKIISHLYVDGYEKWKDAPFFWIQSKEAKEYLLLNQTKTHFTYNEIKHALSKSKEALKIIASHLNITELVNGLKIQNNQVVEASKEAPWNTLKVGDGINITFKKQLAEDLVAVYQNIYYFETFKGLPFYQYFNFSELKKDPHFHLLPGRYSNGAWLGLSALWQDSNVTLYKDTSFFDIRGHFLNWLKDSESSNGFANALLASYKEIEKKPFLKGHNYQIDYPSIFQLKLELWYSSLPIIQLSIIFYLITIGLFIGFPDQAITKKLASLFFFSAFIIQVISLIARTWILMRPPVSNMFETAIYVPCIATLTAIYLAKLLKSRWPLLAAALSSTAILGIVELSEVNQGLENVQAVLNSNFWLTVHVLMIVASYGVLILAGILAHLYLFAIVNNYRSKKALENGIIHSIYIGTALLIPGTILGGVWAAQSWGRFWDWDPKESWAFISICTYLILIHLYRFNRIHILGLSYGAIIGLGIISFTWYGVNYILGTGMHTYGFGSASHAYYFTFLLVESAFLLYMAGKMRKNFLCKTHLGYIKD